MNRLHHPTHRLDLSILSRTCLSDNPMRSSSLITSRRMWPPGELHQALHKALRVPRSHPVRWNSPHLRVVTGCDRKNVSMM